MELCLKMFGRNTKFTIVFEIIWSRNTKLGSAWKFLQEKRKLVLCFFQEKRNSVLLEIFGREIRKLVLCFKLFGQEIRNLALCLEKIGQSTKFGIVFEKFWTKKSTRNSVWNFSEEKYETWYCLWKFLNNKY